MSGTSDCKYGFRSFQQLNLLNKLHWYLLKDLYSPQLWFLMINLDTTSHLMISFLAFHTRPWIQIMAENFRCKSEYAGEICCFRFIAHPSLVYTTVFKMQSLAYCICQRTVCPDIHPPIFWLFSLSQLFLTRLLMVLFLGILDALPCFLGKLILT